MYGPASTTVLSEAPALDQYTLQLDIYCFVFDRQVVLLALRKCVLKLNYSYYTLITIVIPANNNNNERGGTAIVRGFSALIIGWVLVENVHSILY